MPGKTRRILLGRIARAHGVRGEVLIHSFTDEPQRIAAYGPLTDAQGRRTFRIEAVRPTAKGLVARIAGIGDRTTAETLAGTELFADRARLPEPEGDAFYQADLIGLTAVDPAGRRIGEVIAVLNFGAGDILEIRLDGAAETELVPFTRAFTPEVALDAGRITVVLPEEAAEGEETDEDAGRN